MVLMILKRRRMVRRRKSVVDVLLRTAWSLKQRGNLSSCLYVSILLTRCLCADYVVMESTHKLIETKTQDSGAPTRSCHHWEKGQCKAKWSQVRRCDAEDTCCLPDRAVAARACTINSVTRTCRPRLPPNPPRGGGLGASG